MAIRNDSDILRPLIDELLRLASRPEEETKKKLWADHQALKKTIKIPVCVYYELIPGEQWELMLGKGFLQAQSELARSIESQLKKRIWMAQQVPDDHVVWPHILISAVLVRNVDFGVPLKWESVADGYLGAKKIVAPFEDGIDLERLKFTDLEVDEAATARCKEEAAELVAGKLPVIVHYPNLGYSPLEKAMEFRGMENLMFDVMDDPDRVHGLMRFLVDCYEKHHQRREEKGWINCVAADRTYAAVGMRVNAAYLAKDYQPGKPRLRDEWAYVGAESSGGMGPEMYAEFIHPYHVRLARYFTNRTVYYHGCEPLDQKLSILATLPNLRRLHVSPWSSTRAAKENFQGSVVLEVHAHPSKVFFGFTRDDMKIDLRRLAEEAKGVPFDLNLSDIYSVNGNPLILKVWAEAAQEVAEKT